MFRALALLAHSTRSKDINISGLELADWEQEARVVMLEVIRLYNNQGPRMFSCFFKECLTNRIRDIQRQTQAHKRIPAGCLYALSDDFAETLTDFLHHSPDDIIYCRQSLDRLLCHCSTFERKVLVYLHTGYSITEIAGTLDCSKRSVQSALHRCHGKLLKVLKVRTYKAKNKVLRESFLFSTLLILCFPNKQTCNHCN